MAKFSRTNAHNFLGAFVNTGAFPSSLVSADGVEIGDTAYSIADSQMYVMTDTSANLWMPTAGAPMVWKPGQPSAGNVFGTWAELYAVVSQLPVGHRNVVIDTSLGAATITDSFPYSSSQCNGWAFRGYRPGTALTISGTVLVYGGTTGSLSFEDLAINVVTGGFNLAFNGQNHLVSLRNCAVTVDGSSSLFYAFGTTAATQTVRLENTTITGVGQPTAFLNRNVAATFTILLDGLSDISDSNLYYLDAGTTTTVNVISQAAKFTYATGPWMVGTLNNVRKTNQRLTGPLNGTQTGTTELLIGAVWLEAGATIRTARSRVLLGGSGVAEVGNLYIRRFTGLGLLTSFSHTGTLADVPSIYGPATVPASDWYGFYLAGGSVTDVAVCRGYLLDVESP